jgi:translocator protein
MERAKKAWINGIFFVATLVVNTLGATGIINGLNQKQISDMYLTLITPSPSTFGIWGLIYSLLLASVIVMIARKNDTYYDRAVDRISTLFRISCVLNLVWIVAFSFVQIELSVLFIFGFLITLALICKQLLEIHEKKRWLLPLTFGIYTGWLFIATVVNISAALVKLKWNGFGIADDIWAMIILLVAVILVFVVLLRIRNAAFPLPIAWAFFGIDQFLNSPAGSQGVYGTLQTVALLGMVVLIVMSVFAFYKNRFSIFPDSKDRWKGN